MGNIFPEMRRTEKNIVLGSSKSFFFKAAMVHEYSGTIRTGSNSTKYFNVGWNLASTYLIEKSILVSNDEKSN